MITRLATLIIFTGCSLALGQSTTQNNLGVLKASEVSKGLGWQVNANNEVEFAAVAAAGGTHVRIDACVWSTVEKQSAPPANTSTGYSLPVSCINGLTNSKKYGLTPTVIAAYGAPFHQILTLTLASTASAGSTSISVEFASGVGGDQLSDIAYPNDYILQADGDQITKHHSYSGSLITGIKLTGSTTATITLSSALSGDLAAGTSLAVNEILYPSVSNGSPTDPSNAAFARYARYLATQIVAYGLTGEVEIWNEPPWTEDCWDNRTDCFDVDPKLPNELKGNVSSFGLAAALQTTVPVPGVNYVWAGTNKSAGGDLLGSNMMKYTGVNFIEPQLTVTAESLHPYGSNPEDNMWNQPCLEASPTLGQKCNTTPSKSSNFVSAEANNLIAQQQNPLFGISHSITETGAATYYMAPDHLARFMTRQFLGYMADAMSYIDFYRLYDTSNPGQNGFSFVLLNDNNTTYTPLPQYTALAGLMDDLSTMNLPAVTSYTDSSLPAVTSYSGTYNLDNVTIVGARPGDKANSIMYVVYQQSAMASNCSSANPVPCWGTLAQPPNADTTVSIPTGMKIAQVVNLDTRADVAYTQSGSTLQLGVSDDPIEIMFVPSGDSTSNLTNPNLVFDPIETQTQGNTMTLGAFSNSDGAISYSLVSGPATISGNVVNANAAGKVVVRASQAASGKYAAASVTTSFMITAADPGLAFTTISSKTFGDVLTVKASSRSPGAIVYSVVSGPATVAGSTVTMTGAGTVTLQATQAASGSWAPDTATISFNVAAKAPTLAFATIPSLTYGTTYTVNATSNSSGTITYSVISGPATISGAVVTPTAGGQVKLLASLAADGGYLAASTTTSFHVNPATPALAFVPIAAHGYNETFTVSASSPSTGNIVYTLVSGPARISGSTITTLSTDGTVVVKATQANTPEYNLATATTSFSVAAHTSTTTPTLAFQPLTTKTLGSSFTVSASSASSGAITYSVASGPATISGNQVTPTAAGTVVVKATQAASGNYNATTATVSVPVVAQTSNLALASIGTVALNQTVPLKATSLSNGAITYSVVSGPASVAGSTLTSLSTAGTVVLQASQAASGNYAAATATTSFKVAGADPNLVFVNITPKTFGDTVNVRAHSASSGAVQYSVVSGPAQISGNSVTMVGAGTVVLQAAQAADSSYGTAFTTISFPVAPDPQPLTFVQITPKTVGDTVAVKANSSSKGAITYSVLSGPATINGNAVHLTGAGTVTLQASQVAFGVYPAGTATISFQVASR